jgi:hypothetical protein
MKAWNYNYFELIFCNQPATFIFEFRFSSTELKLKENRYKEKEYKRKKDGIRQITQNLNCKEPIESAFWMVIENDWLILRRYNDHFILANGPNSKAWTNIFFVVNFQWGTHETV